MATLVDQFGNPISQKELAEPQTSGMINLTRQFQAHPARGLTPLRLQQIFDAAEHGNLLEQHELFTDMEERDAHLYADMEKRKRAVIKLDWDIKPPRNASKDEEALTQYIKEALEDMPDFEDIVKDMLDAIGHGFSCLEFDWQMIGKEWVIQSLMHRPQEWFQMDLAMRSELRLRDHTADGQALRPFGWVTHIHKAKPGYLARSGLYRVLAIPYLFKNYAVGDLAEFLDIYGIPVRIGKFPTNATKEEKSKLWQAVAGIGHNAAGIIPQSMAIELEQAASGSEKPYEAMISWCERSMSKAILGGTLTSESHSTGMNSSIAEIHNEVRMDIRDSDCKQVAGTITSQIIYPLLALNKGFADIRRCPRFVFDVSEPDDIATYADSLLKLVSIGVKIPENWVHERLKIPVAMDSDVILSNVSGKVDERGNTVPQSVSAQSPKNPVVSLSRQSQSNTFADQVAIDIATDHLSRESQNVVEKWLEPAITALKNAETPEKAMELLAKDNPLLDDKSLIEIIARAIFISELAGAQSVLHEIESN